jgi:hypothetical protein
VSKRKCLGGSKGYFLLCSVVNTKRTPWWAYGLVAILFVSFRLSNINSGNGLSSFSPALLYTLSPKEKIKYRSQKQTFFAPSFSLQVCAISFLAGSFGVLAKNML